MKHETRLLINSRCDIALATGADGVHLPSNDITASEARAIWSSVLARNVKLEALCGRETERSETGSPQPKSRAKRGSPETSRTCIIAVSCHTAEQVRLAETEDADFAVFGPVFEKVGTSLRVGLEGLRTACQIGRLPVLAIGGVTLDNAAVCIEAGAAGVAAIRLFQENEIIRVVEMLHRNQNHVARAPSPADVGSNPTRTPAGNSQAPLARFFKPSYRRRLPHLQRDYKATFVTFRTWGSLVLPEAARDVVLKNCLHDDGVRLRLHAAVVMPDHVHLILTALTDPSGQQYSLVEILQALKGASAHAVNKLLGRKGPVWQDESFDHVLRSNESLLEKIEYVRQNPVRKGLVTEPRDYRWFWQEQPENLAGGGVRAT